MKKISIAIAFTLFTILSVVSQSTCFTSLKDYSYNFPNDGPYSTNIGDINGDNIKDVVFTTFSNKLITLIGSNNGTFTQSVTLSVGTGPAYSALKDLNGDNNLDMVIANYGTKDLTILLGNGTGSFVSSGNLSCGTVTGTAQLYDLKVVDMNNDNINDIVCLLYTSPSPRD